MDPLMEPEDTRPSLIKKLENLTGTGKHQNVSFLLFSRGIFLSRSECPTRHPLLLPLILVM